MISTIELLVRMLDEAYERKAWHGTNLRGAIRGVSAEAAVWRPEANRHNIAELVVHAAYWKYTVRRRLTGMKKGSFALKGSDWFERERIDEGQWREDLDILNHEHRLLRASVAGLPSKRLDQRVGNSRHDHARLIYGAASHDLYHTGQISLIKRLWESSGSPGTRRAARPAPRDPSDRPFKHLT